MGALALYSVATVMVNKQLLTESASVSVKQKSGNTPVFTTPNGLSGVTQGSATIEISVDEAVPSADFDLNPKKYMPLATVVDIDVTMAGQTLSVKGFLMEADYSHSVNDSSKISIQFLCRYGDFEG